MATKVYGFEGAMSTSFVFSFDQAKPFRAEFTGGRPDLGVGHPAKFVARTLGQQLAIEHSPLFRSGCVKLLSGGGAPVAKKRGIPLTPAPVVMEEEVVEEPDEVAEEVEEAEGMGENNSFPNVTTFAEAVQVLKSYGVAATHLRTKASAKLQAESLGLEFPNFEFE